MSLAGRNGHNGAGANMYQGRFSLSVKTSMQLSCENIDHVQYICIIKCVAVK